MKAIDFVMSQPWAMLPEMVQTVISIAERTNESPEMVAARTGRPLDNTRNVNVRDGVAVIPVCGVISRYSNMFTEISGATSVQVLATDFRAALDDPDIKGIVLEIDSPGGQASGIGELAAQIRAGSKMKPVTCYVSNLGASAGYWLAAAGSRVVIAPTAILGSIGVVQPVSLPRKDDKGPRSIEFVSSQSPNKRPDPESDAGRAEIQRTVDAIAQVFVESIADFRKLKPEDVIEKGSRGGLLVGKAAVDAGLADRLGSLESCIEDMSKSKPRGGRADHPLYPLVGAAADVHMETPMKFTFSQLFTGWMKKGCPEVLDTADIQADPGGAPAVESSKAENVDVPTNANNEAAIATAREKFRAEMAAELRAGRVETYGFQADAWLSLLGGKTTPGERDNLKAAYVAAAMIDAESPVKGFSALGGFRAGVESRKPAVTEEIVSGDANTIADHLSKNKLKVMDNAAASPDEAAKQESDARMLAMLGATEEGQAILSEMKKAGK